MRVVIIISCVATYTKFSDRSGYYGVGGIGQLVVGTFESEDEAKRYLADNGFEHGRKTTGREGVDGSKIYHAEIRSVNPPDELAGVLAEILPRRREGAQAVAAEVV